MDSTIKPKDNDVIKGRGNGANLHPGNIRFRQLVKVAKEGYVLSSKADKKKYADCIVHHISNLDPPGRFLGKDKEGRWYVMSERKAKVKTRQALREGAPAVRKAYNDKMEEILDKHLDPLRFLSSVEEGTNVPDALRSSRSTNDSPAPSSSALSSTSSSIEATASAFSCGICGSSNIGVLPSSGKITLSSEYNDADSFTDGSFDESDFGIDQSEGYPDSKLHAKIDANGQNDKQDREDIPLSSELQHEDVEEEIKKVEEV